MKRALALICIAMICLGACRAEEDWLRSFALAAQGRYRMGAAADLDGAELSLVTGLARGEALAAVWGDTRALAIRGAAPDMRDAAGEEDVAFLVEAFVKAVTGEEDADLARELLAGCGDGLAPFLLGGDEGVTHGGYVFRLRASQRILLVTADPA